MRLSGREAKLHEYRKRREEALGFLDRLRGDGRSELESEARQSRR